MFRALSRDTGELDIAPYVVAPDTDRAVDDAAPQANS
jgi:hypothetical protein